MRLDAVRGYERGPDADVERTAGASVVGETLPDAPPLPADG